MTERLVLAAITWFVFMSLVAFIGLYRGQNLVLVAAGVAIMLGALAVNLEAGMWIALGGLPGALWMRGANAERRDRIEKVEQGA